MKRGFFFLRDCDYPAHQHCGECSKAFCNDHLRIRPGSSTPVCLDCLGKKMQKQPLDNKEIAKRDDYNEDYYYDSAWCYGYRSNYYATGHYSPWYFGNHHDNHGSQFTEHDIRVFEPSAEIDEMDAEAPDPDANVFDS